MGRIVVIGAGRSGVSAAAYLTKRGRDVVMNERRAQPDAATVARLAELNIPGVWGDHPLALLDGCDEVLLSPGVPPSIPFVQEAQARGIPVIGELELAHRVLRERVPCSCA